MKKISLFASGSGTNVENIIKFFENSDSIQVSSVFCNNKNAYVIQRARQHNIPVYIISKNDLYDVNGSVIRQLEKDNVDYIILAGFLLLIPEFIIDKFEKKIINIHPALLPNYGGKGMYGDFVHKAVINNGDTESGISIHTIDKEYDKGTIIFQARCEIRKNDTYKTLADKIHTLEQKYFPEQIKRYINIENNII